MMLHEFVTINRQQIIKICSDKVIKRFTPGQHAAKMTHGVPLFLEQLVDTLKEEQTTHLRVGDADPTPAPTKIGRAAAIHGAEMLRLGFSVDQVVHDYGDVCQSVTALAVDQHEIISADEFRTLNRCLDSAIADAVSSFGSGQQTSVDLEAAGSQQRLMAFVAEHRRLTNIARQALAAIKTGTIGVSGATGELLAHALHELGSLTERKLPEALPVSPGAKAAST